MAVCGCARWCCPTCSSITTRRTRCTPAPASTPRASSPRCSKRWARISRPRRSSWPEAGVIPGREAKSHPGMTTVYLAGPDVFLPDAVEIGHRKVELCARFGLTGLYPLDTVIDLTAKDATLRIFRSNEAMMDRADAVIANLTPFRGPSADAGTVYELGYMAARGKLCTGYSNVPGSYMDRVERAAQIRNGHEIHIDRDGNQVED